ncbi:MAG: hypothetical protein A2176_07905 [Spirochaetes bacterium RBG_13_51_14]|nr:MAG: hypothetical protein A2176_07905 [Spirochaetes bacterium RBG_13_51_14]
MKLQSTPCLAFLSAAILTALTAVCPLQLHASGKAGRNADILLAQYITDDKEDAPDEKNAAKGKSVLDYRKREMEQARPRFIMGLGGGMDAREGAASIFAAAPLGIQYGRYAVTAEPAFLYMSAKSIKTEGGIRETIIRTKTSGQIYEFGLPFKFSYSILDLSLYPYTPYAAAGIGYSFRKFSFNGSSLISMAKRNYYLHSMTLDFGFGFLVKTTETTRVNVGLTVISYFNEKSGRFDYDTTGASILFGMMVIFN